MTVNEMGKRARAASRGLASAGELKTLALKQMAQGLTTHRDTILAANQEDLAAAEKNGMSPAMLDRLALNESRMEAMADGILQVAACADPVGRVLDGRTLKNGLSMRQVTVPMGVIGIIFEARPNVTADAAALCLKAGSAVILRGGKEAYRSNRAITDILCNSAEKAGLSRDCVQLVDGLSRQSALDLMNLTGYLDLLIPRGGAGLIKTVVENARVPVIETGVGNCHIYVDESAELEMAADIVFNAKTSRPSVCNAAETLLVHKKTAEKALPVIKARLDEKNVELRGCEKTQKIIPCVPARESDWETEFLDTILAVKVVESLDEALEHIGRYSSGHSEAIVTRDLRSAQQFTARVDSAAVYVNASTRFTDGAEMGLGAEIGISTQKLHARGPMGLGQLVSYKYIIEGQGQVR